MKTKKCYETHKHCHGSTCNVPIKHSSTIIRAKLNGKQVLLSQNHSTAEYYLTIDGIHQGTFILFGSAIDAIEKKTGVNYPF